MGDRQDLIGHFQPDLDIRAGDRLRSNAACRQSPRSGHPTILRTCLNAAARSGSLHERQRHKQHENRRARKRDPSLMISSSPTLPPETLEALAEVGSLLDRGDRLGVALGKALSQLAGLEPGQIARADTEIATAAGLHHRLPGSYLDKLLSLRASHGKQLLRTPGLEYLFLFHRDGRLREAALRRVTGGLPNAFLFSAVCWRLNDWAKPVRDAAVLCANRTFPLTDPAVVAQTATELLVRQKSWGRWRDERDILDRAFSRDDVAALMAELVTGERTGPQASALHYALRTPALDPYLERIARDAIQPSVRAAALNALINGRAEWPAGWEWQWIDKPMGLRRRVAVFDHRPLTVAPAREMLFALGVCDRSAAVRKIALTGVIRYLGSMPEAREIAAQLVADRSPAVRERAAFILRSSAA